jgi:hypothetical protein
MGISGFSGEGVQVLNLSNNTFNTPFPMHNEVSENISIDSGRNLILSPGEGGVYALLKVASDNSLTEYGQTVGGTLDSAAEDCTTGIALSAIEFTDTIYITDLTQATFTPGSPGTWTSPGQILNLNDSGYSAGTSGITCTGDKPPGRSHRRVWRQRICGPETSCYFGYWHSDSCGLRLCGQHADHTGRERF